MLLTKGGTVPLFNVTANTKRDAGLYLQSKHLDRLRAALDRKHAMEDELANELKAIDVKSVERCLKMNKSFRKLGLDYGTVDSDAE